MLEVKVNINRGGSVPDVGDLWLRRDYDLVFEQTIALSSTRTEIKHHLSTIQFIYVKKTAGDDDDQVFLYKNRSPESLAFTDALLAYTTDLTNLSLKTDGADVVVRLFLAGE